MDEWVLYHGSPLRVPRPQFGVGNPYNDYGLGFYCTESIDLACEWACPRDRNGMVNRYRLSVDGLAVFDLDVAEGGTLSWLAVLLTNRQFDVSTAVTRQARNYVLTQYPAAVDASDVVVGYRADDSYFSFAKAFLDNRITLRQLERALRLGGLGRQVMLKSERAFQALAFEGAEVVQASLWHERRMARDEAARSDFRRILSEETVLPDDIFAIDLVRGA